MKLIPLLALTLGLSAVAPSWAEEAASKAPDSKPRLAYGLMMKQGEKLIFSPCRDRSYALVEDVSNDGALLRGLRLVGLEQGKKLYVELLGVTDGVALKASALNLARTDGRCQQPGGAEEAWQAAGQDWALAAGGEQVLLKQDGQADLSFPYREFTRTGTQASYQGSAAGQELSLQLENTLCHDPAANTVLGWRLQITLNGKTREGCAWQR